MDFIFLSFSFLSRIVCWLFLWLLWGKNKQNIVTFKMVAKLFAFLSMYLLNVCLFERVMPLGDYWVFLQFFTIVYTLKLELNH